MAEYGSVRRAGAGVRTAEIDAGLRAHMNSVYGLMSIAMAVTALVAYVVGQDMAAAFNNQPTMILSYGMIETMLTSPVRYIIMFAPLAVVILFSATINRLSKTAAQGIFFLFAALMGLSISWIFIIYTDMSIAQTFLITAIAFAGLSLWGYTTKKDISGWGTFLIMGVIGLIIASVVNIFLESSALQFAVSAIGLLIFAGLTAYDTQKIKTTYIQMAQVPGGQEWLQKGAIMGALNLYLDFINMFMFMLQFMGGRE
ncbi:Bax inhibitor-1/YccA family protein [Abyssibius alkaniclasticus]|uniref:Bax inhibitor-1/YccA family protein n=1 Tax=Abyssibius alkaniclasticus TaxID=2881234 RepID=UPI0023642816|nr:Bax inhibitor-1/YccA family protein [Abyssibius alkaniclasticus]UPH71013.1 Bax inhibitor-1/YccA family protein [Abyssibius alkaniclasticus]